MTDYRHGVYYYGGMWFQKSHCHDMCHRLDVFGRWRGQLLAPMTERNDIKKITSWSCRHAKNEQDLHHAN
eukprot:scaffold365571_cov79-Cyclotella_meneghiniana.AAC.2